MKSTPKSILARAVLTVLKPLLRVLIRNEISHAEFAELSRQAYVDVAYDHFTITGKKMTYARVAVLTGLSRKEVVRLSKVREAEELSIQSTPNRAMRVINGWMNDAEFQDDSDQPAVLPMQGEKGSFSALVARYSGDITLGAIIDELERIGVASRIDTDKVKLDRHGYIPQTDELEKIKVLAMCTADLLGSGVHNIEQGDITPRFQRQIVYPEVPEHAVKEFKRVGEERANELLQELNQLLAANKQIDSDNTTTKRVGLGIYYFEDSDNIKEQDNNDL